MLATFLGFHIIFNAKPSTWMDAGIMAMFYALYFGVMARDFAEICTEKWPQILVRIHVCTA